MIVRINPHRSWLYLVCFTSLAITTGCESRAEKLARLHRKIEVACGVVRATKTRLDSTFGHWLSRYPDTLLLVTAAYGDTIGEQQAKCDAATREYENATSGEQ